MALTIHNPEVHDLPVAAQQMIFEGTIVGWNANHYIYALDATSAHSARVAGVAMSTVDNRGGADGERRIAIAQRGFVLLGNDATNPIKLGSVGGNCYASDNDTVTNTGASDARLGYAVELVEGQVLVALHLYFERGGKL